ncbi:hypothetical protein ElyMa_001720100 [Elysia marginata]|uniref:Uncharacterized protein n=1 Tax=Elysia marginata TaxID=1093978 RepID=A0AAV4JUX2_9GAST|nr:hypothetical protein ElyMa_001720100 [Elysia marginata]
MSAWRRPRSGGYRVHADTGLGSLSPSSLPSSSRLGSLPPSSLPSSTRLGSLSPSSLSPSSRLSPSSASSYSPHSPVSPPYYTKRPTSINSVLESTTTSLASGPLFGGRDLHGTRTDRYRQPEVSGNTRPESFSHLRPRSLTGSSGTTPTSPISSSSSATSSVSTSPASPPPATQEKHHHWRLKVPGFHHHRHQRNHGDTSPENTNKEETGSMTSRRYRRHENDGKSKDTDLNMRSSRTSSKDIEMATESNDVIRTPRRQPEPVEDKTEGEEANGLVEGRRRRRRQRLDHAETPSTPSTRDSRVQKACASSEELNDSGFNVSEDSSNVGDSTGRGECAAKASDTSSITYRGAASSDRDEILKIIVVGQEGGERPKLSETESSPGSDWKVDDTVGDTAPRSNTTSTRTSTSTQKPLEGDANTKSNKSDGDKLREEKTKGNNSLKNTNQGRQPVVQIKIHSCDTVDEGDEEDDDMDSDSVS